jgi:hypothetical protein
MAFGVLALVGTRKGLFLLRGDVDRRGWRVEGPLLDGWVVYHATVDARDGHVLCGGEPCRLWSDGPALGRRRQDVGALEEDRLARVVGANSERGVAA